MCSGCPATPGKMGQNDVVLVFDDGDFVVIDLNKTTKDRANFSAFIGQQTATRRRELRDVT